jgi:pimeloyl-ACP methyl ester carboxylesterase
MPTVLIDGIETRYEVIGSGAPLLMFSPGGFNATLEQWSGLGIYARTKPLEHLARQYSCIVFDRRETGQSGGRIERVTWDDYVAQGMSPVLAFGVAHPARVLSMVLYWPVGGARYRMSTQLRFAQHQAWVQQHGMAGVVELVKEGKKPFNADPRGGPWASVIARDPAFAERFATFDAARYQAIVAAMARTLVDRDSAPGAEPEDLMALDIPALVIPGKDASHATSAARYLEECLPLSEYWDMAPDGQTEDATSARLLEFLGKANSQPGQQP